MRITAAKMKYVRITAAKMKCMRITAAEMKYVRITAAEMKYVRITAAEMKFVRITAAEMKYVRITAAEMKYVRITAAEMKYIRRTAGYDWTDYKTNAQVAYELKITQILDKLLEYRRSWIQDVNRMPRNRLLRVMKHYCPTGRRNRGRPLKKLPDT